MKLIAAAVPLLIAATPAFAQDPDPLTSAAYDRCLAETAVRVAGTDVPAENVFAVVKQQCAATRATLAKHPQMLAALDTADATSAANFPDWIGRMRERRQLRTVALNIPAQ